MGRTGRKVLCNHSPHYPTQQNPICFPVVGLQAPSAAGGREAVTGRDKAAPIPIPSLNQPQVHLQQVGDVVQLQNCLIQGTGAYLIGQ